MTSFSNFCCINLYIYKYSKLGWKSQGKAFEPQCLEVWVIVDAKAVNVRSLAHSSGQKGLRRVSESYQTCRKGPRCPSSGYKLLNSNSTASSTCFTSSHQWIFGNFLNSSTRLVDLPSFQFFQMITYLLTDVVL